MKLTLDELPVYVAHYTRLHDRRANLQRELSSLGINARWVTCYDQEDLTTEIRERYYLRDDDLWRRKIFYASCPARELKPAEISLAIKHIELYRCVMKHDQPYAMVLEDDVIFAPDFRQRFDECFAGVPDDFDFVFFGSGCNMHVPDLVPGTYFYRKEAPATKCTDSYLVAAKAVKRLLLSIPPVTLPIDFELNFQLHTHSMNVYWLEPPITEQGSQNGADESVLQ